MALARGDISSRSKLVPVVNISFSEVGEHIHLHHRIFPSTSMILIACTL